MAKHLYKILTQDAAEKYGAEMESEAELDLSREQRLDVIAAGWVEPLDDDDEPDDKPKKK